MTTEATAKLFYDAEKTKLVLENDPDAKILAAAVGDPIPEGFTTPAGMKAAAKAEDKKAAAPANKGGVTIIQEEPETTTTVVGPKAPAKKAASK